MEIKFCHLGDCEFVMEINSGYRLIKTMHLEVLFCGSKLVSTKVSVLTATETPGQHWVPWLPFSRCVKLDPIFPFLVFISERWWVVF